MATVKTSGTQAATVPTEHVLATVTDAGVYQLVVDTSVMVNGDELELKIYGKVRTGDTERLLHQSSYAHVQTEKLKTSLPAISPHHMKVTLNQLAGTTRTFIWAVYET